MKKQRIVSILLAFLLLLPAFADITGCGLALYAELNNPFSYYDRSRDAAFNGETLTKQSFAPSKGGEKYIVAFKKDSDRRDVYNAVKDHDFTLPAYSSEMLFVVSIADIDSFKDVNSGILRYVIPDTVAAECMEFHAEYEENVLIGADDVITSGGEGVVVAVLDSGIERENGAFASSVILDGWDCTKDEYGVNDDGEGHGTRVSAIIVSSDTGIARGASLLPVKITDDAHKIMTSDLVEGLYYAADYGADVINMSFGGYFENIAEKEAVSYAASKGCILVASAGNEGNDPELAGKMSYPASFDKVISVASVNVSGKASTFSQFNEKVDIASPGELLHLVGKDDESPAEERSGTSYATAYVSAAAALAVSRSERKLDHDGFEKLLEYSSVTPKNTSTGYGVLNIPRLLESLDKPVVSGVVNGGVYFEEVRAYFENASALLDGEEYESGDPIFSQGSHTLVVTDEYGSVSITFDVDTVPLTYEIVSGDGWAAITFANGSATLDGEKYVSGTHITGHGSHKFVLTGRYGNSVSDTVFISYDLPSVYGVADGGEYDRGIYITTTGGGHTYLNGKEFTGGVFVGEKGEYVLRVTDDTASMEKEIRFTLTRDSGEAVYDAPYSRMTHTGKDGIVAFWDNGENQFALCKDDDISVQTVVNCEGAIVTVGAFEGIVCVVTNDGWYFYDASSPGVPLDSGKPDDGRTIVSACYCEEKLVYTDNAGSAHYIDGENLSDYQINGMNTAIEYGNGRFYLYSAMNPSCVYVYDGEWSVNQLPNYPMMFRIKAGDGIVCVGSTTYDATLYTVLCELPDTSRILWSGDGMIITSNSLYTSDGSVKGVYPDELSYVCRYGGRTYFICSDGRFTYTDDTENFGSFVSSDKLTGVIQSVRPFEYVIPLVSGKKVKDACFDRSSGLIDVICSGDNRLYYIDPETGENVGSLILRYAPSSLRENENGVSVVFMNSASVYLTDIGGYVTFPARVSDVCVSDGRIFAVCGNRLCEYVSESEIVYPFEGMSADAVVGGNGMIFVSSDYTLLCCDITDMSVIGSAELFFRGRTALTGKFVCAGSSVYTVDGFAHVATIDGTILAVRGNSVITDSGLCSAEDGRLVSAYQGGSIAVITDGFDTFFFGDDSITVIRSDGDMCDDVVIDGVADGGTYEKEAAFTVSRGTVYIDGVIAGPPYAVNENGRHVLRVSLPWGMSKEIAFDVVSRPEAISVSGELNIALGRRVKLTPSVTPDVSDVRYTYTVISGDSATVSGSGYVTAVSHGSTVIEIGVEGTELTAYVTVNVRDYAINPTSEKYVIDRDKDLISGIDALTDVASFLADFSDFENTHTVTLPDGTTVSEGIVRTGMIINKYTSSGTLTDSLVIAVKGDLDGDGKNTLNDARLLYDDLRSGKYPSDAVKAAADVNLNGSITVSDFKALRSLAAYDDTLEEHDGYAYITCPAFVCKGGTFYVTFRNDGLVGASAVSGEITYDSTAFELVKTEYYRGEIYTENEDGKIRYSIYGIGNEHPDTRLFRMYFYVKPSALPGRTSVGLVNTVISLDKAYLLGDRYTTPLIKNESKDFLAVSLPGSDLDFSESITEYDVTVPLDAETTEFDVNCPAHHYVYYNDVTLSDDEEARMIMEYVTPTKVVDYVFNIRRGIVHIPESDPSLHSVKVTNGRLVHPFSPDITKYTVIPDGEVTYDVIPNGSRTLVEYIYSDDGNVCTVKCTAENGSVMEYVFTLKEETSEVSEEESSYDVSEESEPVSEESETEESVEESSDEPVSEESVTEESSEAKSESGSGKTAIIAVVSIASAALIAVFVILFIRKKKNKSK